MKRLNLKILLISLISLLIVLIFCSLWTASKFSERLNVSEGELITIPQRTSIDETINILNSKNLFKPGWLFGTACKIFSIFSNKHIYSGTYRLSPENTNEQLLKSLFSGNQLLTVKVTFPEGLTLWEFASISEKYLGVDSLEFIKTAHNDSLLKAHGIKAKSAEGYLMPDTYNFFWKLNVKDLITKLLEQQTKIWDENFRKTSDSLHLSRFWVLTLASIVEAESPLPSERPRIAGLYMNRLNLGWKLESDPTTQYAVGSKKRLTYDDLESENPYNTYKFAGLPPGPINCPSKNSIYAVLHPEHSKYLYFVAKGDGSNEHNFAENALQHQINVKKYRKAVRNK